MRDDKFGAALSEVETWIWIAVGLGLLLFVGIAVAAVYYLFLYAVLQYRYSQLQLQAGDTFDTALLGHGDFEAEHVAHVIYGTAAQGHGTHSTGELIFGVGVRHDD